MYSTLLIKESSLCSKQWKTTTDKHNQSKFSIVKPSLNVYIYKHSDADDPENIDDPGNIVDKEAEKLQGPGWGVGCKIVSQSDFRSNTHY